MLTTTDTQLAQLTADLADALANIDWDAFAASVAAMSKRSIAKAAQRVPAPADDSNAASQQPAELAAATRHAHADLLAVAS
jgi:hypothetical protein